jgi:hypothetical protein
MESSHVVGVIIGVILGIVTIIGVAVFGDISCNDCNLSHNWGWNGSIISYNSIFLRR